MANFHGPTGTVWATGDLAARLDADPNYIREKLPEKKAQPEPEAKPVARQAKGESK